MNDMLVGILGLAAIAATVISLTRGKMLPAMAFILWPSVLALAMVAAGRCNLSDIEAMLMAGFGSTAPTAAMHKKIITRHAGPALLVCTTMMGAAVFTGILTSSIGADGKVLLTNVIELPPDAIPSVVRCLANLISNALPASLGKHLHLLLCALAVPLALSFDTDSYFYGMLPIMLGIGQAFGLEALPIAITMHILRLSATFICPMTAALLLATGMADVPIRSHLKASALYVWSFSFLCLVFAIFIGLVPF